MSQKTFHTMLSQVSRTMSARTFSRVARRTNGAVQMRGFIAPTVSRRADFVQELYLKELKAYKPAPVKDTDAEGQVQVFNLPKAPKHPEETDLASTLQEYERMVVEVEGQETASANSTAATESFDWLEDDLETEKESH